MGAYCQPADRTGGDIYDLVVLPMTPGDAPPSNDGQGSPVAPAPPQSLVILLADAMGHGIGPALSVTQARSMLRLGLRVGAPLEELVRHINAQVHQDLSSNRFITAFMGCLDLATHRVNYLSAGQGPIIHVHAKTGRCDLRRASTVPMGIMDQLPLDQESEHLTLKPGDMLVLLTDGFFEAQNAQHEQLGNDRICHHLTQTRHEPAQAIVTGLVKMLREFTSNAPAMDDLTAVIVRRV
jgi:phosphoserine phosphatase